MIQAYAKIARYAHIYLYFVKSIEYDTNKEGGMKKQIMTTDCNR